MKHSFSTRNRNFEIKVLSQNPACVEIQEGDERREVTLPNPACHRSGRLDFGGEPQSYWISSCRDGIWVTLDGHTYFLKKTKGMRAADQAARADFAAPMPGKIIAVKVEPGSRVNAGDVLVLMEAMKMEHRIEAPCAGKVTDLLCAEGQLVEQGAELLVFEAEEG